MDEQKVKEYFQYYLEQVLPLVKKLSKQKEEGYHGLYSHTEAVVFRGIDYAIALKEDPLPVILACAMHDAAKNRDGVFPTHGPEALPLVQKLLKSFKDKLTKEQANAVLYAVEHHTFGRKAPDYVSACTWDADRTRLSWERGYIKECFSTPKAKKVASHNAKPYLEYMQRCTGKIHSEHD